MSGIQIDALATQQEHTAARVTAGWVCRMWARAEQQAGGAAPAAIRVSGRSEPARSRGAEEFRRQAGDRERRGVRVQGAEKSRTHVEVARSQVGSVGGRKLLWAELYYANWAGLSLFSYILFIYSCIYQIS